jgi:hypothetical protein
MKTSLWIVIVVVMFFLGFLIGYSMSPPSNLAPTNAPVATDKAQ